MLTAEQKTEAEKKLQDISAGITVERGIKQKIRKNDKNIKQLVSSFGEESKGQINAINQLINSALPRIFKLEEVNAQLINIEEQLKRQKEKYNKQKLYAFEDKQKADHAIEEIKKTIIKIQNTVKESIKEQQNKRIKIQKDLQVSLDQVREKIKTFEEDSTQLEQENIGLRQKVSGIKIKMQGLEDQYKKKAQEKDDEVKQDKQQLLSKLKLLQEEVNQVTELNKTFTTIEKQNFDKKLSLYLRTKKFPQYFSSFENSAKTIDQCKEELILGVQRLQKAQNTITQCDQKIKNLGEAYLNELKRKGQQQQKIDQVKRDKDEVRQRIIQLQNQLKQKNSSKEQ